jgi:hypothetical protein
VTGAGGGLGLRHTGIIASREEIEDRRREIAPAHGFIRGTWELGSVAPAGNGLCNGYASIIKEGGKSSL